MTGSLSKEIEQLLLDNEANVSYCYVGPYDKTKQIVRVDNLLHLAAKIKINL